MRAMRTDRKIVIMGFLQLDVTILLRYCKAKAERRPLSK